MSEITLEMLATIEALTNAKTILARISTPILMVLGNISEIMSIIILAQNTFRKNSCAIYFLAASCTRLVFINTTMLLNGLSFGYESDPSDKWIVPCRIKIYLSFCTTILPPSFVVLACIDRLVLSSMNANLRWWSQPRFAYRSTAGVSVFWILFSIHGIFGAVVYSEPGYSYCYVAEGPYRLFVVIYSTSIIYLLPPILMVIFGSLTILNVRQAQRRVRAAAERGTIQRKDRHLMWMLLFQVIVSVIFTIPMAVYQISQVATANSQKNIVWQMWETFFAALGIMIFFIPYCTSFYIYTLTASVFRGELKRIVNHCFRRFFPQQQMRVTTVVASVT